MSQSLDVRTVADVLDAIHSVTAATLSSSQKFVPAIHNERARLAEHDASPSAHGVDNPQSALCAAFAVAAASGIGTAPSVKKLADDIGGHAATLADIARLQDAFGFNIETVNAVLTSREVTLTQRETAVATFLGAVATLRDEVENGSYGGGGGSPVSLPTLSGPDQIGIGLSAEYTLFCIGSAIEGATIASFEVTFAGGEMQTVPAVGGMAAATVTAPAETAEGSVLTLSVVAVDSSGFRSKEATKEVTAIQYVVQAPSLTTPAPGGYVSPASVAFVTSAFAVVGPTDTHAASRFKLTSDTDGTVIAYDSGRTTSDLTTHTANLSAAKLTPGATYYAWAQHEGASLGIGSWSNPVAIVAASVVTPQITSPSEGAEISPSNVTVTTTAFAVIGGITDTHASTDWRITSDAAGETVIAEALASADLTSHVFASPAVTRGQTYYLWARHRGTACGAGAWAKARVSIQQGVTTPSGRLLYLNETGDGIVMEHQFTKDGSTAKFVIALAKDRTKKKFGTYGTDMPGLTNYAVADTSGTWYLDGKSNNNVITKTDAQMRSAWSASIDDNTAKQNCDVWMTKNSTTDTQGIVGVPAVAYCRSVTVGGVACDLPNIQELMLIRLEADAIDALDPTVAQYPTYALGSANTAGFWSFGGPSYAFSSTEYDSHTMRHVHSVGNCLNAHKNNECCVAPVREL